MVVSLNHPSGSSDVTVYIVVFCHYAIMLLYWHGVLIRNKAMLRLDSSFETLRIYNKYLSEQGGEGGVWKMQKMLNFPRTQFFSLKFSQN